MVKFNIWDRDNYQILLIFTTSIVLIYFTNPLVAQIGYLLFLLLAYNSKKDYIWLAFLFIILDTPNYFFTGGAIDDPTRVPIYSFTEDISLTFQDLLIIVLFLKSYRKKNNFFKIFQNEIISFAFVFLLSFLISFIIGVNFSNVSLTIRSLFPLLLIFTIPKILYTKEDWINFLKIIFPIVIFTFIGQIYFIITLQPLASLVSSTIIDKLNANFISYTKGYGPSRFYTGVFIGYISFIAALYMITIERFKKNRNYFYIISSLAALQPILSATRAYTIAFLFVTIIWLFTIRVKVYAKLILIFSIITVLLIVNHVSFPTANEQVIKSQVMKSFDRLTTIVSFAEGDLTAEGTYGRITYRTPRVINKFLESPVVGFGFSDEFFEYADDHVALPNTLLNNGILGFIIFYITLFSLFIKILKSKKRNVNKTESVLFTASFVGLFMIHLFGRQMFGFYLPEYILFFVITFLHMWYFFIQNPIDLTKINVEAP